jgi:L-2-hydroxyglutarate oxidase LhgO
VLSLGKLKLYLELSKKGINGDVIAGHIQGVNGFKIEPRIGEYIILAQEEGIKIVNNVLLPVPSPKKGKGILVFPTYWGFKTQIGYGGYISKTRTRV